MTIPYRILFPMPASGEVRAYSQIIEKEINGIFTYIDSIFNSWNSHSELSKFNRHGVDSPFRCSWDFFYFLQWVDQINISTKGYFDPAVETLHVLWKKTLRQNKSSKPSLEELSTFKRAASWCELIFLPSTHSIQKKNKLTQIDLSAVIKGYTVDILATKLSRLSWSHCVYIEWGGEIATRGQHPEGRPWKVELMQPTQIQKSISDSLVIDMKNSAIASSGDMFQTWTITDSTSDTQPIEQFTHIFTPGEDAPLEQSKYTLSSVTVLHPTSCALADALATALFATKDSSKAQILAQHLLTIYPDISIILFDRADKTAHIISQKGKKTPSYEIPIKDLNQ